MVVKFRKAAIKFLQKASPEDAAKIQSQLNQLLIAVEEQNLTLVYAPQTDCYQK